MIVKGDFYTPWFEMWPQTPLKRRNGPMDYFDDPFRAFFGRQTLPPAPAVEYGRSQQYQHHGDTCHNGIKGTYQDLWIDYFGGNLHNWDKTKQEPEIGLYRGELEDYSNGGTDADLDELEFGDMEVSDPDQWIPSLCLTNKDKKELTNRSMLSDKHMYAAQKLLKRQFPDLGGLQDTCLSQTCFQPCHSPGLSLQIHHTRGNHWVLSSSIGNNITIYDSIYDSATDDLLEQLEQIHPDLKDNLSFVVADIAKQRGSRDCGLFVIANAMELCHGRDPQNAKFNQRKMRRHLIDCFENQELVRFPQDIELGPIE